ncbi:MAG: hypothetical protein RIR00_2260 [Pseudomonadota bacterium]|jgi:hypothetical protein
MWPPWKRSTTGRSNKAAGNAGLTSWRIVVIFDNTNAELITRFRSVSEDDAIVEMVIWRVPEPIPPSEHGFKYRLVYVVDHQRVVGFDNERGKGDHKHIDAEEQAYAFIGVDQLIDDFFLEVEKWKNAR